MSRTLFLIFVGLAIATAQPSVPLPVPLQYTGRQADRMNIVFLGDGFTHQEIGDYQRAVDRLKQYLLATHPFSKFPAAFNVWRIDVESPQSGITVQGGAQVNTALGVVFDGQRLFYSPNEDKIRRYSGLSGVRPNLVIVVANDSHYGGAERRGLVYVSLDPSSGGDVLAHEVGHSFCIDPAQKHCLDDEYAEPGYQASRLDMSDYPRIGPNLVPPVCHASSWCAILTCSPEPVEDVGCHLGGHGYGQGVYHSREQCKMYKVDGGFCPVCSRIIEKALRDFPADLFRLTSRNSQHNPEIGASLLPEK